MSEEKFRIDDAVIDVEEAIQERKEQTIIREFIDADSTDAQIEQIIQLVEAGLGKEEIRAFLQGTGTFVN